MNLTPQIQHFPLGNDCYASVLRHPSTKAHGRRFLVYCHGGGGGGGDCNGIFKEGGNFNKIATQLNSGLAEIDVVSLSTPQGAYDEPTQAEWLQEPPGMPDQIFYPEAYTLKKYAIEQVFERADEIFGGNPERGGIAGSSYGAMCLGAIMLRDGLPGKFFIAQWPLPDVRTTAQGVHTIYWEFFRNHVGVNSQAEWDAIPLAVKQQLSIKWYIERGLLSNWKPLMAIFERVGDHIKPYGDPTRPYAAVHDAEQFSTLRNIVIAAGQAAQPASFELLPWRTACEDVQNGEPLAQRVEAFIAALT